MKGSGLGPGIALKGSGVVSTSIFEAVLLCNLAIEGVALQKPVQAANLKRIRHISNVWWGVQNEQTM